MLPWDLRGTIESNNTKRGIVMGRRGRFVSLNFKNVTRFSAVGAIILAMCLSGCRVIPEPGPSSNVTFAAPIETPLLPVLIGKTDGSCAQGQRVSYVWPRLPESSGKGQGEGIGDLGDLVLEELWPISVPRDNLVACADEQVLFSLFLPQGGDQDPGASGTVNPERCTARLDLWAHFEARDAYEEPVPLHTEHLEPILGEGASIESADEAGDMSLSWSVPPSILKEPDNSFVLRLTLEFGEAEDMPTVSFAFVLMVAQEGLTDEILNLSSQVSDAAWSGDEEVLSEIFPEWDIGLSDRVMPYNAHAPGTGKTLLWRAPGKTFALKEEPEPKLWVTSFGPSVDGPYAEVSTYYEVQVQDDSSGVKEVWAVEETVNLRNDDSGDGSEDKSWKVFMLTRSSVLLETTDPHSLPGLNTFPEINASEKDDLHVLRVGPFYQARPWDGRKWSHDGKYVAFPRVSKREEESSEASGASALRSEGTGVGALCQTPRRIADSYLSSVWAICPDDGTGVRLFAVDSSLSIEMLDWARDGSKVRFMVMGLMTAGPYVDESGYWVVEVDLDSLEVQDIAFVRYPSVPPYPADLLVAEDGQTIVFRHLHDLWKVNMETKEALRVADDLPTWDGLFSLSYSPSGLFAAYGQAFDVGKMGYVSYDLTSGETYQVEVNPSQVRLPLGLRHGAQIEPDWASFWGFSPQDEVVVELCRHDELNYGESSSVPAGGVSLCLYTPRGDLKHVIPMPTGDEKDRIGPFAWSPSGDKLAMVSGPLGEIFSEEIGFDVRHVVPKEIWIWDRSKGETEKLCDILVEVNFDRPQYVGVESIEWIETDGGEPQALEAWFLWDPETGTPEQKGIRVDLDGNVDMIERVCPYSEEGRALLGAIGDITFVAEPDEGSTVNAFNVVAKIGANQSGDKEGKEILITENGPLRIDHVVIENDKMVMTGQTPDEYGNGSYWIYVIYR